MVTPERLAEGTLVTAEVIEHHHYGIMVRLLRSAPDVIGLIDLVHITNELPIEPFVDYPVIGTRVEAVVLNYTSTGELRLSSRFSDLDPILEVDSATRLDLRSFDEKS
jgi:hypothetical protein